MLPVLFFAVVGLAALAAAAAYAVSPGNTATVCVPGANGKSQCVRVHRAHADTDLAARRLVEVRELLFVTLAFLREKYQNSGDAHEKLRDFNDAVRPRQLHSPELKALAEAPKQAQLLAAFDAMPADPTVRDRLATFTAKMLMRWDPTAISEGSPYNLEGETAYTVAHGQSMVYCLRSKDGRATVLDREIVGFVALHELAHVFTPGFSHPPCFWEHFGWLLHEAAAAGIYVSKDYSRHPQWYCGLYVDHNPLTDGLTVPIWRTPVQKWSSCVD